MSLPEPVTGLWTLKGAHMPKDAGTVFSCFACAGGSTMGYKLAGFDVIGCNEIDPDVFAVYKANHKPRLPFVCSIREMLEKELPEELFKLDILDGSPPCTPFSTAGNRDKDWGKAKKFNEGQAHQRLDDLFFEFIALASRLQPKLVISENVSGIVQGKARGYVKEIVQALDSAGYDTQIFKLNAANMGVPQSRQRVFFLSRRKDLELPKIDLRFKERPITFGEVESGGVGKGHREEPITPCYQELWARCQRGSNLATVHPTDSYFSAKKWSLHKPAPTLVSGSMDGQLHPTEPRRINTGEIQACSTFPTDMKFPGADTPNKRKWFMGMSVPPFMVQRIALVVRKQWMGHA